MEYRRLGASGFSVPALSFGTGTFGGKGEFFQAWGSTDVAEARRLIDICLEAGLNMFDTADIYSSGAAEEVLGKAIEGRPRDSIIISTKATFRSGDAPNQVGSSRAHLTATIESQLKRLGTDYIDIFQLHGFDALTPVEEVLLTLDHFVRAGKIRYIGVSNFSGWHIMKSLACADRHGYPRYVANQNLLFPDRPRVRARANAARPRPGARRDRLEPARLGASHRQDQARPAAARDKPPAQDGRCRTAARR